MHFQPGFLSRLQSQFQTWWVGFVASWRINRLTRQVAGNSYPSSELQPVAFFNASSRLTGLSLNAAFTLLTACGLQIAGVPVVYFGCHAGMSRCVLGTNRDDPTELPPCKKCISQSKQLFAHTPVVWFKYVPDNDLIEALEGLGLDELSNFEFPISINEKLDIELTLPIGQLIQPSLRWVLRRHNLSDSKAVRCIFREYILSAAHLAEEFIKFLDQINPSAVVLFNGMMFPEAIAKWIAGHKGIRVVTHEVGFQPFSGFFSNGHATAYPIHIPDEFELSSDQKSQLNAYLEKRFQGEFTMAGIRFWPEMNGLDSDFLKKAKQFKQIVPIFTNVVYDTSQVHANVVFDQMFAWLDLILEIVHDHPNTLFVIRAHPDEMRPGTKKQSRESVQAWVEGKKVSDLSNVVFINSQDYLSSYELIQRSKFVMIYNSSIGLEAALMGKMVLCGGKARFTQYPTVEFPATPEEYRDKADQFLSTNGRIQVPSEYSENAHRFLYFQLFKTSLPFGDFLENLPRPGYVRLQSFNWQRLSPEYSKTIRILVDGILHDKPFMVKEYN
jgi:hypothetical protein